MNFEPTSTKSLTLMTALYYVNRAVSAVRICRTINPSLISSLLWKSDVKHKETMCGDANFALIIVMHSIKNRNRMSVFYTNYFTAVGALLSVSTSSCASEHNKWLGTTHEQLKYFHLPARGAGAIVTLLKAIVDDYIPGVKPST